jgi:beta-lactamase regulating signal transducer with metallopeptidase domain
MNLPGNDLLTGFSSQLWQVTAVVLVVAAVTAAVGRRHPHMAYLLWLLVVVKCLTPPLWSSPLGLISLTPLCTPLLAPEAAGVAGHGIQALGDSAATRSPAATAPAEPIAPHVSVRAEASSPANRFVATPVPRRLLPELPTILALVWGAGVVVCSAAVLIRWLALHRAVGKMQKLVDGPIASLAAELSGRLGLRRRVRVAVSPAGMGPAVFGLLRPTIVLPEGLLGQRSRERIESVLAHELVHLRRWDTTVGLLQVAASVAWWFHPLVWWSSRQMTRVREQCCDEETVASLRCRPADYAQSLLDVIASRNRFDSLLPLPGMRAAEITSKRLEKIMKDSHRFHRSTPRWCWAAAAVGALLLLPGKPWSATDRLAIAAAAAAAPSTSSVALGASAEEHATRFAPAATPPQSLPADAEKDPMLIRAEATKVFRIGRLGAAEERPAQLVAQPAVRYVDPFHSIDDGTLWIYGTAGRPLAVQKMERWRDPGFPPRLYGLFSLSEGLIEAQWPGQPRWSSAKPGVELRFFPGRPAPASTEDGRLLQMKEAVRRFSATLTDLGDIREEMSLLPGPIHRYRDPKSGLLDGATFAFAAYGTNPEFLVLIELRGSGLAGAAWHYGPVRLTAGQLSVRLDGKEVWTVPREAGTGGRYNTWLYFFSPEREGKS